MNHCMSLRSRLLEKALELQLLDRIQLLNEGEPTVFSDERLLLEATRPQGTPLFSAFSSNKAVGQRGAIDVLRLTKLVLT